MVIKMQYYGYTQEEIISWKVWIAVINGYLSTIYSLICLFFSQENLS